METDMTSRSRHVQTTADRLIPGELAHVGASLCTIAGAKRRVPSITLRGDWLKALGFPIGAPICLFAEGHGRMAICRLGLGRPRWLHIVAPKRMR
jgi:hypothetical protein